MNIIVTMAGHSRRFRSAGYKEPKFMIDLMGMKMIEHVIRMFSEDDKFYFVLNSEQVVEKPEIISYLNQITPRSECIIIEPHELGPAYTAIQVEIPEDESVIVTYCDFYVGWNYKRFLREVSGYDGAAPAFKGFHPASFGNTNYAYMLTSSKNELIELREKQSFTSDRANELASTGIYYFARFGEFKKYATELLSLEEKILPEAYVSLILNLMVRDGQKIFVPEVDKFICLGTPEDVDQFKYWGGYFNKELDEVSINVSGINLIPMAGKGSRFKAANYRTGKPMITLGKKPMVQYSAESMPVAEQFIFLVRQDDEVSQNLKNRLCDLGLSNQMHILTVEGETTGQAATCYLAKDILEENLEQPVLISSCDYKLNYDRTKWAELIESDEADIFIWTIRLGGNLTKDPKAFAYCKVDSEGNVVEIVEKNTISDNPGADSLVVGTFWFKSARIFLNLLDNIITQDLRVNNEHYIGNGINSSINEGLRVKIFDIENWISFGDPFELDLYYYWEEFFRDYV